MEDTGGKFPSNAVTKALSGKMVGGNLCAVMQYAKLTFAMCAQTLLGRMHTSHVFCGRSPEAGVYDVVVVGGGIVGLATAREVAMRHPNMHIALVEKENQLALHQTGHNSGVIHMGIYYKPGSLKAKLCVQGAEMVYKYLDDKNIPYKKCGKVIVAVDEDETLPLKNLYMRACANKCKDIKMISAEELRKIEPHCTGKMALHSPNTGIVDWGMVARSFGEDFKQNGGKIITGFEVAGFDLAGESQDEIHIQSSEDKSVLLKSRYVITCCGLHSDRMAQLSGCKAEPKIVPFRGEYLLLNKNKSHLVNGNIYPVPDPQFPFLGVHFTPRMDGSVWCGPNAVLAFSREGYNKSDFSWTDFKEMLTFKGLRTMASRHWRFGTSEMYRSIIMRAQLKKLQKYIPTITIADVSRGPSGVRAQAMNSDGSFVEDFVFDHGEGHLGKRILHVRNAPSPGATASLAIANMITDEAQTTFNWNNTK